MTVLLTALLLTAACGGPDEPNATPAPATSNIPGPTRGMPARSAAGMPPFVPCLNPKTPDDVKLGAYVVVEATVVPGPTPSGGLGSVVPLSDVTILWQAARNNPLPRAIADSVVLEPGRYVLLLGAGRAGRWYAAMGYRGVFAYVDPQGSTLTELCVTYSDDGSVHPATKAPGSISRTELLALVEAAPLPDPMYSPPP